MHRLLFIIGFILCSLNAATQDFLDKEFYLIDSIKTSDFENGEMEMMDSVLTIYHESDDEILKLQILDEIVESIQNNNVWLKFNTFRMKYCYHRMFSIERSIELRTQYRSFFARGLNSLGKYEMNDGNQLKSLDYYFVSLEVLDEHCKADVYAEIYTNIGSNYFHQGEFDQAQEFLQLAHDSLYDTEDKALLSSAINNLAVIYQQKGEIDSSLKYHFESLNLSLKEGNLPEQAMSYNNIGGIYSNSLKDSVHKGIEYLNRALEIFKNEGAFDWISLTYYKLALSQLRSKQYDQAEKNANFALHYANQSGQIQPLLRSYKTIYEVKKEIGKKGEALEYYEKYVGLRDSIYSLDTKAESSRKELEYQYKSEKDIAQKENEKNLALEKSKKERQQLINYWIIAFIALALIFAAAQLFRYRKMKKQSELLEKQSDERKILLKEIHHRVKNNFQIICSVLRLQAYDENNPVIDAAFEDAVNRIQSMAEVHEMIYKEEAFSSINPKDYFERLTASIQHLSYDRKIHYIISSEFDDLPMEVIISLGISVNELITNSIKHAFQNSEVNPEIAISIIESDGQGILTYQDNGIGYNAKSVQESFGTELIKTIIEQINGQLQYRTTEKGSEVVIGFMIQN